MTNNAEKYLLATNDFSLGMQDDINHYVTRDRINNASFRQTQDPTAKYMLRRQKLPWLFFQDISTFDADNSIVGLLVRELDVGKKDTASELIIKALQPPGIDYLMQNRLKKLRNTGKDNNSNKNNNHGPSPPPLQPSSIFQPPPPTQLPLPPPPFFPPQPPLPLPAFNNFQPPLPPANQHPTFFNILPLPPLAPSVWFTNNDCSKKNQKKIKKK